MKPICLLALPRNDQHPAHWWRLADDQLQHGQLLAGQRLPAGPDNEHVVLALSGEQVVVRWLDLPAHSPAQARTAGASALADDLLAPPESLHAAAQRDGTHWQLMLCAPQVLEDALARARALGVSPAQVIPDSLLLPVNADSADGVLAEHQGLWLWRSQQQAVTAEPALIQRCLTQAPAKVLPLAAQLDLHQLPESNLLQGRFAPGQQPVPLAGRRLGIAVAALVLALPLAIAAHGAGLRWQASQIQQQSLALARQHPGIGADNPEPVASVHALAAQREQRQRQWSLLRSGLQAVQASPDVALEQLQLGDGRLILELQPATATALAQLHTQLHQQGLAIQPSADPATSTTLIITAQELP